MSLVGYARVSSTGQSLEVQLAKLNHCNKIFQEKKSATTANRPQLQICLDYLREGDTLVITKLDRLARSTFHLTQIAEQLKNQGIELVVTDQNIDTSTPTGKLLFNMLGAIAEFENDIRRERQTDGIQQAKERGVQFGAKAKLTPEQVEEMRQKRATGVLIKDLMKEYGLSKASVYRLLKDDEQPPTATTKFLEFNNNKHLSCTNDAPLDITNPNSTQCQIANNSSTRSRCRATKDTQLAKIRVGQRNMICRVCPKHIDKAKSSEIIRPHASSHPVFGG